MNRLRAVALLVVGVALLAGCAARTPAAGEMAAPSVAPAPVGPLVSAGRAAQGPVDVGRSGEWVGLPTAYAYVNRARNDCAQAAVATALTTTGRWARPDTGGPDRQAALMATAKPDVLGGVWGSSPRLVKRMLGASTAVQGMTGLEESLREGRPVVVMLDLGPLGRGRGAHWTVVVGMDATHVQVTNLGGGLVRRDAFEKAWGGLVPTITGVARTGLRPA